MGLVGSRVGSRKPRSGEVGGVDKGLDRVFWEGFREIGLLHGNGPV